MEIEIHDWEEEENISVLINVYQNAHKNARYYYDVKKYSVGKEAKTKEAMRSAVKKAEKKAKADLSSLNKQIGKGVIQMRKIYWWEKFSWFITSENYIVISGKDA